MNKVLSVFIIVCFIVTGQTGVFPVHAQDYVLPAPGVMVSLSPAFDPPILTGIKVHPDNPFRFDFILDQGGLYRGHVPREAGYVSPQEQLKQESTKLIKYFLASLTIPEKDLWVNLSPYEKDRIIPQSFGLTEMGRDLLAEDYMLKQITASLIYPEGQTGRKFWKRIYEESSRKFGTTDIPVNTFNKVWIVPQKAVVYENTKAGTAYVVEAKLKVMLEQDYLSLEKHTVIASEAKQSFSKNDINAIGSQIVREIVIPELTKEVNEGKNFAQLRQVYNSLILATWYKKKIRDSILEQVYADKKKIAGVGYKNSINVEVIYQRYLQAFKKGVYNYIKEEKDPLTLQLAPRKYFSGGASLNMEIAYHETTDPAMLSPFALDHAMVVYANINPAIEKSTVDQVIDKLRNEGTVPASIGNKIDPRDQRLLINFKRLVQFINFAVPYYQISSIDSGVLENFIKTMDSKENPLIDNRPSDGTYDSLYIYNLLLLAVKRKNREVWNNWVERANEGMDQQETDSNEENRRYAVTPENLRLPETISVDDSYDLKLNKRFGRSAYITCEIIEKSSSKVAGIINLGFDRNTSSWLAVEPHGIQIKDRYRGQGLGRKAYLKLANKLGVIRSAGVTSDRTSPDAQNMWQKMGAAMEYIGYYPMPYILSNESGWSWVIRSSQLAEGQSGEKGTLALIRSQTIQPMNSVKIRLMNRIRMGSFLNPRRTGPQEEQEVSYNRGLPYISIDQFTAKQKPRVDGVPYIYINEREKTAVIYGHGKAMVDGTWCLLPKVNGAIERVISVSYYLKALSEEGIKEVLILACNPYAGGFTVPSNMQVTYSTSFVIKSYKMMHGQWVSVKADDQDKVIVGLPETDHLINDITRFIKKSIVRIKQSNGRNQILSIDPDYQVNHFWGSQLEKGGIDLTPAGMSLQTKTDSLPSVQSGGIRFHLDPAMLQKLQNAPGFVPVIINIQPMTDLRMFLGVENEQPANP